MLTAEAKKRARYRLAALYFASVFVPTVWLFFYSSRYHEPWRDEVQALLIGRDVPFSHLIYALRLEGTPPLFHLLLRLLCSIFWAPTAMALGGVIGYAILLVGTLHLLRIVSRRPRASMVMTLVLACTNTYAYELGVISRPYGLGLGLLLAAMGEFIVAHRLQRPRRVLQGTLLCGFAAITSAHAACVAGAVLSSFAVIEMVCRRSIRPALPTLAALPFFGLTWYLIAPFSERTPEVAQAVNPEFALAWQTIHDVLASGALGNGWWTNQTRPPFSTWPIFSMFVASMAIFTGTWLVRSKRNRFPILFVLGIVALSWATLLYIFVVWYTGGSRHHQFLWMPAVIMVFGFCLGLRPWRIRRQIAPVIALILLGPWFLYKYRVVWEEFSGDYRGQLTDTKTMAELLPPNAHVITDHDFLAVGLHLWRDDLTLQSQDSLGRRFNHLVVDRQWHERVLFGDILSEACSVAPERTMLVHSWTPLGPFGQCMKLVRRGKGRLLTERSDLYSVDCSCAQR